MLSVFVFRIRTDGVAVGALAGEVEHVDTGERQRVRSAEELIEFLTRTASGVEEQAQGAVS